ncbi:hypothetical protein UAJ10_23295 [Nitrospirillum sp. BR 11164]|uniref:hypothetical protein n=1 Tax=Nitrospirillum sp. BR 11164 TaxID=3104324 RepID=UPI002AFDCFEF|nr:hypothetical protein [Nitrospirillum sp. BR 11164]MEA1651924.1 hypothetical protein [Nitrospirillum sp. BR 11164]
MAAEEADDVFQPSGDGYVFRKGLTGPAIRVTASERAVLMFRYERRRRTRSIALACAVVAYPVTIALLTLIGIISGGAVGLWALCGLLLLAFGLAAVEAGPLAMVERAFGDRQPEDAGPPPEAVQREMLRRRPWWQIVVLLLQPLAFTVWAHGKPGLGPSWRLGADALAMLSLILIAVLALCKWRADQGG